jgi:hypothetical protein
VEAPVPLFLDYPFGRRVCLSCTSSPDPRLHNGNINLLFRECFHEKDNRRFCRYRGNVSYQRGFRC